VDSIAKLGPAYQKWYMDDGGIIGDTELLRKVWGILKSEGPDLGMFLNPKKCEWSWLNRECSEPCPIELVQLVPTDKIQMLGVPLGSDAFVADYVERELLPTTVKVTQQLVEFEDTQSAMYLLRLSFGIVRANHFMRTTPLCQWEEQAKKFDSTVHDATELIIKHNLPSDAYDQACVSTRFGGLGIRRAVDHAPIAFAASYNESEPWMNVAKANAQAPNPWTGKRSIG